MSRKVWSSGYWIPVLVFLLSSQVLRVNAQEPVPDHDDNCIACHTHRYYLYDSGKWFCLCDAPMHCIYCHGGRTDTTDKNQAHEGLVLYPTHNHAERCRSCHVEDYLSRVVTFGAIAGIDPTQQAIATATPPAIKAATEEELRISATRLQYLKPWQRVGTVTVGLTLILLSASAYRCYKADCLAKTRL